MYVCNVIYQKTKFKVSTPFQFPVHTCILRLSAPELNWNHQPPPLSGLPEDVLGTVLHFLYAECLPANLGEQTARNCIAAAASLPGLDRLVQMCELYLKNMALKQRMFENFILSFLGLFHNRLVL